MVGYVTKRDGSVVLNGKIVGRVAKTTDGTSFASAISRRPGPVKWEPIDTYDRAITPPVGTKREAAEIVAEYAMPTRVEGMKVESTWGADRYTAFIYFEGNCFGAWRLVDGDEWRVNYIRLIGAIMPRYSTIPVDGRVLIGESLIKALEDAVKEYERERS